MQFVWFCFFFKQNTAYERRISDWSSDVCSSDLARAPSLVSTFKGLPHRLHVADALEGVVGAAAGQLDQMRHQVALDVLWVHEVGHAELGRKLLAGREIGRAHV